MSRTPLLLAAAGVATLTAATTAQPYAVGWHTMDGGGGRSTGAGFTLTGTIGQHDASSFTAPLTGGAFTLVGGFWTVAAGAGCPCEFDADPAQVNVFDLLAYLDLWLPADPAADIDGASGVNVFDLLRYLDCWFAASAGAPCA